jgi:hypothetical protein
MASRRSRAKYGLAALAALAPSANAAANNGDVEQEMYFAKRAVPKAWNK